MMFQNYVIFGTSISIKTKTEIMNLIFVIDVMVHHKELQI